MPHLRFTRDKRGYENTYVVHSERRRGKARQRILYWFRTPPNIRVGRAALDEDAIRAIEERNPDILFDWSKILEAQPPQSAPVEPQERRRRPRGAQARYAVPPPPLHALETGAEVSVVAEPPASAPVMSGDEPLVEASTAPESVSGDEALDVAEPSDIEPALVPVTVYHGGADVVASGADAPRRPLVEARLGSEQLARVRARYAEILARITERAGHNPVMLDDMRRAADALNPDAWVTESEIAAGLQQFDVRLGEIRRGLGIRRRRRSRRGGRRRQRGGTAVGPIAAAGEGASQNASADSAQEPEELDEDRTEAASEDGEDPSD